MFYAIFHFNVHCNIWCLYTYVWKSNITVISFFLKVYTTLWVMYYFPPYNPLFYRRNVASHSLLVYYFDGMRSDGLHSLVPLTLAFATGNCHASNTRVNQPNSLHIPLVRSNRTASSQDILLYGIDSRYDRFPITIVITSSCFEVIIIFPA